MNTFMLVQDQMAYCTVRIDCTFPDGTGGCGTGFFLNLMIEGDKYVPVIVTNRHVIENANGLKAEIGRFCLTERTEDGKPDVKRFHMHEVKGFADQCFVHSEADLAVFPLAPILNDAEKDGKNFFYVALSPNEIPSKDEIADIPHLQEVVMVGYPNGIWDSVNNQPIFRRGITATHPEHDFDGRKEFLIDVACFNGSSGSPVFLFDYGFSQKRSSDAILSMGGASVKLLGVLYAGPQHRVVGKVIGDDSSTKEDKIESFIPNNLGFVIQSKLLLDFEEQLRPFAEMKTPPSRMSPCPCGSGKKFKHCHGKLS